MIKVTVTPQMGNGSLLNLWIGEETITVNGEEVAIAAIDPLDPKYPHASISSIIEIEGGFHVTVVRPYGIEFEAPADFTTDAAGAVDIPPLVRLLDYVPAAQPVLAETDKTQEQSEGAIDIVDALIKSGALSATASKKLQDYIAAQAN